MRILTVVSTLALLDYASFYPRIRNSETGNMMVGPRRGRAFDERLNLVPVFRHIRYRARANVLTIDTE